MKRKAESKMSAAIADHVVIEIAERALAEDLGLTGDVTTDNLIDGSIVASAQIVAKEAGVLAGVEVAKKVFLCLDPGAEFPKSARGENH